MIGRRTWIFIKRQRSVEENTKLTERKRRRKMEDTKKKKKKNINNEDSKKKERHIVTWAPEVCDEYIYTYMSVLNLSVF